MSRVSVLGRDTNYNNYYLYMHLLCSSFSFVTKAADNFSNGNNNNNTGFTRGLVPSPLPKGNFHTKCGNYLSEVGSERDHAWILCCCCRLQHRFWSTFKKIIRKWKVILNITVRLRHCYYFFSLLSTSSTDYCLCWLISRSVND